MPAELRGGAGRPSDSATEDSTHAGHGRVDERRRLLGGGRARGTAGEPDVRRRGGIAARGPVAPGRAAGPGGVWDRIGQHVRRGVRGQR